MASSADSAAEVSLRASASCDGSGRGRRLLRYSRTTSPNDVGASSDGTSSHSASIRSVPSCDTGAAVGSWRSISKTPLGWTVAGLGADAAFAGKVVQLHAQFLNRVVGASGGLEQFVAGRKAGLLHAGLHLVEVANVRDQCVPHALGLSGGQLLAVHACRAGCPGSSGLCIHLYRYGRRRQWL